MQLIGQTKNLEIIDKWNKLPNFIIIQGDRHMGKTYLTKYICNKFGISYVAMNNSIKNVRGLINDMTAGANVAYHFKDFDKASIQAKNALLKISEETPKDNTIIITGSRQIRTLESRARKLVMSAYTKEEMLTYISKYFLSEKAFDYFKAGFNSPPKVLLYKEYEGLDELLNYAYNIFNQLPVINIDIIISMLGQFENKYEKLDAVILFLDMLINIINYKSKYELDYSYSFQNVLDNLIECKEMLMSDPTLNRKFALYKTFYNILLLGGRL